MIAVYLTISTAAVTEDTEIAKASRNSIVYEQDSVASVSSVICCDTMRSMNVLLISTYELGRQPFGLASPAAWLRQAGHSVACADLSRESLEPSAVRRAGLVAFYLPMHTATRLALP